MIFRKLKLIKKLRAENFELKVENFAHSKDFWDRCDYNNLLHENSVLSSRRITDSEYIEILESERNDFKEIKEKYINLLASIKIIDIKNK